MSKNTSPVCIDKDTGLAGEENIIATVYPDLNKAFDKVSHCVLVGKVVKQGCRIVVDPLQH